MFKATLILIFKCCERKVGVLWEKVFAWWCFERKLNIVLEELVILMEKGCFMSTTRIVHSNPCTCELHDYFNFPTNVVFRITCIIGIRALTFAVVQGFVFSFCWRGEGCDGCGWVQWWESLGEKLGERRGLNNPSKPNSLETKNYTRGKSLCCNLLF